VLVDDREAGGECLEVLKEKGIVFEVKRLEIGDFVIGTGIGVERKTASDFEASIMDGRVFQQAEHLRKHFQKPLIAVVGNSFGRLRKESLRGAFMALCLDLQVPVIVLSGEEELGEFLAVMVKRYSKPLGETKLQFNKPSMTLAQQQQFVVEALPEVGPILAKNLLEEFGTVGKVFAAKESRLLKVEKIGEKKARAIRRVIEARFGWEEQKKLASGGDELKQSV
jgi:Fanconi anemia group M protein